MSNKSEILAQFDDALIVSDMATEAIRAKLDQLVEFSNNEGQEIKWGHVASLQKVAEQLQDLEETLLTWL